MRSIILTLPVILLLSISTVNAQRGPMWQNEELNLTEQQQQKLDDLRFLHQKAMIQKKADLKEAELEMRNLMQKTEIDEKAVLEKQKRISALKAEISEAGLKHRLEMRKVLTKEQLEKMTKSERNRDRFRKSDKEGERPRHKMRHDYRMRPGSGPGPERQQK